MATLRIALLALSVAALVEAEALAAAGVGAVGVWLFAATMLAAAGLSWLVSLLFRWLANRCGPAIERRRGRGFVVVIGSGVVLFTWIAAVLLIADPTMASLRAGMHLPPIPFWRFAVAGLVPVLALTRGVTLLNRDARPLRAT